MSLTWTLLNNITCKMCITLEWFRNKAFIDFMIFSKIRNPQYNNYHNYQVSEIRKIKCCIETYFLFYAIWFAKLLNSLSLWLTWCRSTCCKQLTKTISLNQATLNVGKGNRNKKHGDILRWNIYLKSWERISKRSFMWWEWVT